MAPPAASSRTSIGLASWLGGGSVLVVFIAVTAMAIACALLLGRLVEQQGLTRAQLAGAAAREQLRRTGEDMLSDARVLAERPTLQRMLTTGELGGLEFFLRRFCESARAEVCAVMDANGNLLGRVGPDVPWDQVKTAAGEQGERFIVSPKDGSAPVWGASVAVPALPEPGARVFVMLPLEPSVLESFAPQIGAKLSLVNFATYTGDAADPLSPLHGMALADGRSAVQRAEEDGAFVSSVVVATPSGEIAALLDARVDGGEYADAVRRFTRRLGIAAALVAAIAGLAGLLYGRWLARPVVALRDVASRIGQGDFSAAMPEFAPAEVGALGRTMDDMRRNLLDLTATLRQREAEAQAMLAGVVEGVFSVDEDRHIRYANPQVSRLVGRSSAEIVGRFCGDVLNPRGEDGKRPCETNCPIVAARVSGNARSAEQLCLPDGSTRSTIIVSAAPVMGMQTQVIRDETELEAVRRARDGVLGNISHEFRTPLAAQLASIEMLRDGLDSMDGPRQRELLGNVERGVLRLMRLIDNLLESVRIESGQLSIRRQVVNVREVVDEAVELLQPLLAQRGLIVDASIPEPLELMGDAQRLVQVYVNLLSNAIKHAPAGSSIRVAGRQLAQEVELTVEDEGAGLPEGDTSKLFARFQRGGDIDPDAPGLGLGLWIVKSIVERHNGRVGAGRSDSGRTCFTITLPRGELP